MSRSKDDWVGQRAYALWEAEGRPDGRGESHWQQAAAEFEQLEMTKASADGSDLIEKLRTMGRLMRATDSDRPAVTASRPVKRAMAT